MTSILSTCNQRREFYSRIRNYLDFQVPSGLDETLEAFSQQIEQKVQDLRKIRTESKDCVWKKSRYRGNPKIASKAIMVPFINEIREPKIDPSIQQENQSLMLQCLPYHVNVKLNVLRVGNVAIPVESLLQKPPEKPQLLSKYPEESQEQKAMNRETVNRVQANSRKTENVFMLQYEALRHQMRQKTQMSRHRIELKKFNQQLRRGNIADLKRTLDYLQQEVYRLQQKKTHQNRKRKQSQTLNGQFVITLRRGYNEHRRLTYVYFDTTCDGKLIKPEELNVDSSVGENEDFHFPTLVDCNSENKIKIKLVDQEEHLVIPQLSSSWRDNFQKLRSQQERLIQSERQNQWETKSSAREKNGKSRNESDEESQFVPSDQQSQPERRSQKSVEEGEKTKILINLSNFDVKIK